MRVHPLFLALLLLAGCQSGPVRDLDSVADTRHLTPEENRMWGSAAKLDDIIRRQNILYRDAELRAYVQRIADRLYPELKGAIHVGLIDSPDLNAFALPNGSIYFNIGLLARLDNEAQLATILAHEVTHFTRQHALKERRSANSLITAGLAITLLTGIPLSGDLIAIAGITGYSQELETEADHHGFERLVANGYDPLEAPKTFEHLLKEVETLEIDQPYFFSTHPRLEERIKSFQELTAEGKHTGTIKNAETFLLNTTQARSDILQRYLSLHRYKTLILMLESGTNQNRYPATAPFYLGEAYRQRGEEGDEQLAEKSYRQAIHNAPQFAASYRALGILQMKADQKEASLRNLKTYLTLEPDAPDRAYIEQYIEQLNQS